MKLHSTLAALGMLQAVLAQTLAPSPTNSLGCQPHGDHWHCEAARPTDDAQQVPTPDAPAPEPTESPAEEDHDHEGEEGGEEASDEEVAAAGPSPTNSLGCQPHGDHWHCEGPRPTKGAEGTETEEDGPADADASAEPSNPVEAGAASGMMVGLPAVAVALFAQAAFA